MLRTLLVAIAAAGLLPAVGLALLRLRGAISMDLHLGPKAFHIDFTDRLWPVAAICLGALLVLLGLCYLLCDTSKS